MSQIELNQTAKILLEPGKLWSRIETVTEKALKCGALLSIPTECELVEQNKVVFVVRILSNLIRKDEAKKKQSKDFNPFLPYEQDLWVADISDTHVCILNKFNVVDNHLLIITRAFEEQESLLTQQDFTAMWACLADIDGLAFYNGGKIAGASQKHKHLQIVPLPLANIGVKVPIEVLFAEAEFIDSTGIVPGLPFAHALIQFDSDLKKSPIDAGKVTLERYQTLLKAVGLENKLGAYNLLVTREWMLIVARSQECFESISVNSLGFAGALLVRNREQLQLLKQYSAMNILENVAVKNCN
jgi:sulfate adenylyltransferase (ADP) / ATP adenylyltransferase